MSTVKRFWPLGRRRAARLAAGALGRQLQLGSEIEADLAMLGEIEAGRLGIRHGRKAEDQIDQFDQDQAAQKGKEDSDAGGLELRDELRGMPAEEPAIGRDRAVDCLGAEETGEQGAQEAADAVDAEGVERIVILEDGLQADRGIANDAGDQSDGQSAPHEDVAATPA